MAGHKHATSVDLLRHPDCTIRGVMQGTSHSGTTLLAPPTELEVDSMVGAWRLVAKLPEPGPVTTYVAIHSDTKRLAAIEIIDAPGFRFGSYTGGLRTVMHRMNRIGHPGIVTLLDVGMIEECRAYVVRELLDGITLATRLAAGPLSAEDAVTLLLEIADVLCAAHAAGISHGCLELDNVVLLHRHEDPERPAIKLLDWGIAAQVRQWARLGSLDSGSAYDRPPPATDVHDLGVMMYRLVPEMPRPLEDLWLATLRADQEARPTMFDVADRLRRIQSPAHADLVIELAAPPETPPPQLPPTMTGDTAAERPTAEPVPAPMRHAAEARRPRRWRATLMAAACAAPVLYYFLGTNGHTVTPSSADEPQIAARSTAATSRTSVRTTPAAAPSLDDTGAAATKRSGHVAKAGTPKRSAAHMRTSAPGPTQHAAQREVAGERATLMVQHQRVGRTLLELERQFGAASSTELSARFKRISIDAAMATPAAQRDAAAELRKLSTDVESALMAACSKAPDSPACRPELATE